jgi:hypothetical protein
MNAATNATTSKDEWYLLDRAADLLRKVQNDSNMDRVLALATEALACVTVAKELRIRREDGEMG